MIKFYIVMKNWKSVWISCKVSELFREYSIWKTKHCIIFFWEAGIQNPDNSRQKNPHHHKIQTFPDISRHFQTNWEFRDFPDFSRPVGPLLNKWPKVLLYCCISPATTMCIGGFLIFNWCSILERKENIKKYGNICEFYSIF